MKESMWIIIGVLAALVARTLIGWWSAPKGTAFNAKYLLDPIIAGAAAIIPVAMLQPSTGTDVGNFIAGFTLGWAGADVSRKAITKPLEKLFS